MDALEIINKLINDDYDFQNQRPILLKQLKALHTPTKLIVEYDMDGKTLWVCPRCRRIAKKFWSEVETIHPVPYCYGCGQRLEWL